MQNENFRDKVKENVKEIQQEVYIKDETLEKIVAIFLSLKEDRFPSTKPPRGILFYGPPGTGKTLLMKTLAKKLQLSEPIMIRGPEIISQYYGKSEARLRLAFAQAKEIAEKENLAIIFIDELDSLAPRRDMTKGELEPRLVGQLLALMDGLEKEKPKGHVVVIGSTNRPEALDPALRRPGRFDLEIEFDPPDVNGRKEILKLLLKNYANFINNKKEYSNEEKLKQVAEQTVGFTGADLLQLLNESLLMATLDGRNFITPEDLLKAKNLVRPSALREFFIEEPKNRFDEIKDKNIEERIEKIANDFSDSRKLKLILLNLTNSDNQKSLPNQSLSDKIATTIAYMVHQKGYPYIFVRATRFRSRWFGDMEKSIREFFGKLMQTQPCVVYIKNFDAIAAQEEHLRGAVLELLDNFTELSDNKAEVLILCSITNNIDSSLATYFEEYINL